MPTDILRDAEAGRLDLPVDDEDLTEAERDFYRFMNELDGWSSAMPATLELTGPVAPESLTPETLQVWEWGQVPRRVTDVRVSLSRGDTKITIDAPREGWKRGHTYVILMKGGEQGARGAGGEPVVADAAFYYLRLDQTLEGHDRAVPGRTRAERLDKIEQLEEIRKELAPYFRYFEDRGTPRTDVAALWTFTVTQRVELAMDKASQRMPLPIDLLIDPVTGRIDLPPAPWDSETVREAKIRLRDYDGFGTSMNLLVQFTGPIDPATVDDTRIQLYEVPAQGAPVRIPITVRVLDDGMAASLELVDPPLKEKTRYAVVVQEGILDANGDPIIQMPVGHFLRSPFPVEADGESLVGAIEDADAVKLEATRQRIAPFLDETGREGVFTAWPFTTMTIESNLKESVRQAERKNVRPHPANVRRQSTADAVADFALSGLTFPFDVKEVYHGTIASPVFLDPITRGRRPNGDYEVEEIAFTMTIPDSAEPGKPMPVVIFGHAIMTERRFVLAVAQALAARGFAAISIDFPYHGTRTHCIWSGPLCFPSPIDGSLTCPEPCQSGYECAPDGRCVDENGDGNHVNNWPVLDYPQASGAAFIEVEHIANTRDHFEQAVVDLGALLRSLRVGDWESAIGYRIDGNRIYYVGQSLGGIIGGTFVPLVPEVGRAVLNVPGADTVDLFDNSPVFRGHVDAFFTREGVERTSYEGERFLNVARWFIDAVDPQNVAAQLTTDRDVLIQMATLDFVIPNPYTELLSDLSGAPRRDYVGEHAFLVIPIEPAYLPGISDLARFLERGSL